MYVYIWLHSYIYIYIYIYMSIYIYTYIHTHTWYIYIQLLGFPLIYVNKAFEKTTGYARYEIIGKNCRFLQMGQNGEQAEPDVIKRLTVVWIYVCLSIYVYVCIYVYVYMYVCMSMYGYSCIYIRIVGM
jgi:hypothetical protein